MVKAKPETKPADDIQRLGRADGAEPVVDREGGKFGAGIIRGVSLACVGEALGHQMWLDQVAIDQVTEFANKTGDTGLKCRFTHPGMSSDGMGRHLGRLLDVRTEGEKSIGDLHFAESSHKTPDGDLADYVMTLCEEDPKAAGLSIVFHHDWEAESEFENENQVEYEWEDRKGRKRTGYRFESPDERNENNYPHVRMNELRASDIVDEPAANPDGLFDRVPLAREADALLSYAAGLTDEKPAADAFDVDGDRAKQFLSRFLESHGLSLTTKEDLSAMSKTTSDQPAETPSEPAVTREGLLADQQRYIDRFGSEDGVKWFSEGMDYTEALEKFCDKQAQQITGLQTQLDEEKEKLASLELGEAEPVDTGTPEAKKKTFASRIRIVGSQSNN